MTLMVDFINKMPLVFLPPLHNRLDIVLTLKNIKIPISKKIAS